ncbi:hypothetical protein L484_022237 [Morus notabilis]|uniref:Uncharacterized protein n=1 Tax=Morus notabilis TaxID=981085 RepID=W9S641_9ROSA|nr:hypothetical protein L484_022237 [Morus notabilis]
MAASLDQSQNCARTISKANDIRTRTATSVSEPKKINGAKPPWRRSRDLWPPLYVCELFCTGL